MILIAESSSVQNLILMFILNVVISTEENICNIIRFQ